jgi:hypothetical protein
MLIDARALTWPSTIVQLRLEIDGALPAGLGLDVGFFDGVLVDGVVGRFVGAAVGFCDGVGTALGDELADGATGLGTGADNVTVAVAVAVAVIVTIAAGAA